MDLKVDLSQHKFMLALPCYDSKIATHTATSLISSILRMGQTGIKYEIAMLNSGTLLDASRNELTQTFLESDCDIMVCLDSDMVWSWDSLQRLLAFSAIYPVVTGAYQCKMDQPKFIVEIEDFQPNEHGLLPINHIGMGFVAIQKSVFEELKPITEIYTHHVTGQEFYAFFRFAIENGKYIGEDVYFFHKLKEVGIQAMLDPHIELGHVGTKVYDAPFIKALER